MDPEKWARLVAELASMPDVVARLRVLHRDDGTGYCRCCTTPGRGTPTAKHPCSLASLVAYVERHMR